MLTLPIDAVLPELRAAFGAHRNVVLSADPGAGKTTRVPPALLHEPWLAGKKIIMLEPRRLAASRAAAYMAAQMGERAGQTIGYRIRGEARVSTQTRVEVVTEGILTRMLQSDSALTEAGLVIFDEFHERSIHADLGLALTLDVQENLRTDLRILVMSATLDGLALASLLGDSAVVKSEGRVFPVQTHFAAQPVERFIEPAVVSAILRALRNDEGDLLVFLPGQREIRRVAEQLERSDVPANVAIHTLFGEAPPSQQQAALTSPREGHRKVILSTNIAETSLTIDGVRVVIDSGLARAARFDPRRGMSGLVTVTIAQSNAEQRRGRAGRQQPGVCYRLWTEAQHAQIPRQSPAEILVADLAPLALDLARWGTPDGSGLRFLDPPPAPHLAQARRLLTDLGALDDRGKLTPRGRAMADLPIHPRFANMLIRGKELHIGALACDIAALLEERDLLRGKTDAEIDLHSRWYALQRGSSRDAGARDRIAAQAARLRELADIRPVRADETHLGLLLAFAYPERVAQRREKDSLRYQLAGGAGAILPKESLLSRHEYLAIGDVDAMGNDVRIFLAEPVTEEELRKAFAERLVTSDEVHWDDRQQAIVARRVTRLDALELSESSLSPSGEMLTSAMVEGIRSMGLDVLPWGKNAVALRTRSEWLRTEGLVSPDWPDLSDAHLLASLDAWLGPYLNAITKRTQLERLDMTTILQGLFSYQQLREIDRLAPTHLIVPTGSHIPVEYQPGSKPVLAVRLQEMFGQTETPTVAGGRVGVVLHLLSPARRPLAITQDLPSFWKNAYPDARKDMRGKYPKHYWPIDPLQAEPTRRVKRHVKET